jgi:hypothetical protein
MVTSKGNISIGREYLHVYLCTRCCGILAGFTTRGQSWWKMARTGNKKAFCVLEFAKPESIVTVQRRFRTMYHHVPVRCKTKRLPLYWNFMYLPLTNCFVCRWFCVIRGRSETSVAPSQLTQFWQIPRHRTLSYFLSTPCFVTTSPLAVKPTSTPRRLGHKKKLRDSLPIDMLPFGVTVPAFLPHWSVTPGGLMNYPV